MFLNLTSKHNLINKMHPSVLLIYYIFTSTMPFGAIDLCFKF